MGPSSLAFDMSSVSERSAQTDMCSGEGDGGCTERRVTKKAFAVPQIRRLGYE